MPKNGEMPMKGESMMMGNMKETHSKMIEMKGHGRDDAGQADDEER